MRKQLAAAAVLCFALAASTLAADAPKKKLLFFTKSSGFQHDVIKRDGEKLGFAEQMLKDLCDKHDIDITITKDGSIFTPKMLAPFDAFAFYTTGDLTTEGTDKNPGMPKQGKEELLKMIESGKGFIGFHCASDTFHTPKPAEGEKPAVDPYIQMLGGEFVTHGKQQESTLKIIDPNFPGMKGISEMRFPEEWYALKYFAPDIHVILVQGTDGMEGDMYQRPPYPETWAHMHGKGRVFFTSMGHRPDVWTNPNFQQIITGGMDWILGRVDADVTPNLKEVCPQAEPPAELEFRKTKK
jgi:uncharacterized protein